MPEFILEKSREAMEYNEAHFRVGGTKLYFPTARVVLLRPNAKLTPYQAKFIVPKSFNKFDLRDYLWHLYGIRALKITTQLQHAKWTRGPLDRARFRDSQIKKMTIDLEEPFVWPEPYAAYELNSKQNEYEMKKFSSLFQSVGSDKGRPTGAFDGLFDREADSVNFLAKKTKRVLVKDQKKLKKSEDRENQKAIAAKLLGLKH
ncbi:hypothetical protein BABINDRAFT_32726 [Babjeviella inositovora NRRL Y-12698]|uniref:Large ribosomal subunit protein uL23m n=1 Tax=Babjeviella inositovora NRRL Y-12698 TaxID=984486 RepID=A0A1E3QUV0_9ASCO|nr:uncharacterized protein BABINDRAFT_32726 [Babjeviella inositovora NRRL Y-12698]ODQ81445.1 hypothetical protein BABINDRAFT_32726 [Babjeviella inositovora NRRL Y-12698]